MKLENRMEKIENRGIRFPHFFPIFYILLAMFFGTLALAPSAQASVILGTANMNVLSNGLVGYWPLDGATTNWTTNTTRDLSGQANTGTLVNLSTTTAAITGKIGGALKFDGSLSNIDLGAPSSLNLPGAGTISAWINPSTVTSIRYIFASGSNDGGLQFALELGRTSGKLDTLWGTSGGGFDILTSTASLTANKWQFVTVTRTGSGSSWTASLYINGVLDSTQSGTHAASSFVRSLISECSNLGVASVCKTQRFSGPIDDVRVYNRVLSAQEVALLYASGQANTGHSNAPGVASSSFNFGLTAGLVAYWTFDGPSLNWRTNTVADVSGNAVNLQFVGTSTTTAPVTGKIGGALNFNGSTSYAFTNTAAVNLGSNFTITIWAKWNGGGLVNKHAVDIRGTGLEVFAFQFGPGDAFFRTSGGTVPTGGQPALSFSSDNKWHQYVAIANGTNVVLYKDGVQVNSAAWGGSLTAITAWTIGTDSSHGSYYGGALDEVRIYNRALSAQDVKQLYALGAANVAHSNTVTLQTGLVGYWTLDGGATNWRTNTTSDLSGQSNTGTLVSMSTSSSPVAGKIGGALNFNGSSYIDVQNSSSLGVSNITVSAWVKPNAFTTSGSIVNRRTVGNVGGFTLEGTGTGFIFYVYVSGSFHSVNSSSFTLGQWQQVTATYDGQTISLYKNGVLLSSSVFVGSINDPGSILRIGKSIPGGSFFNGTIDDVRIYNRALSAQEIQQLYSMGR